MADSTDIFDRLEADHDKHRALLDRLDRTQGEARRELFEEFTYEVKGHAAAEEQALYSTMLRKPEETACARHSVAEHHEIEELLNDVAAVDGASAEWPRHFAALKDKYLHHIREEEDEMFPRFARELSEDDAVFMRSVFERRKAAEKARAEITPEKLEDAKE